MFNFNNASISKTIYFDRCVDGVSCFQTLIGVFDRVWQTAEFVNVSILRQNRKYGSTSNNPKTRPHQNHLMIHPLVLFKITDTRKGTGMRKDNVIDKYKFKVFNECGTKFLYLPFYSFVPDSIDLTKQKESYV